MKKSTRSLISKGLIIAGSILLLYLGLKFFLSQIFWILLSAGLIVGGFLLDK